MSKKVDRIRAPDNFLKQGVADASLGAKGVFLQNPEVFSHPNFYTRAFLEFGNLVQVKEKLLRKIGHANCRYHINIIYCCCHNISSREAIILLKKKIKDYQTDV